MKPYLHFIIVLLCCFTCVAQIKISGTVKDENNNPIASGSVVLKNTSGLIESYTTTNELGNYSIVTQHKGTYILFVSSMGYEQKNIEISLAENDNKTNVDFKLHSKTMTLKEIEVKNSRSITIKKDTVVFNAKSFAQGNEQVVEDLLKKIPGLNVASDGTIKVGNQEVEKVMIDGDDFFEKGYKLLTKNMPVHPIDKIELYQNYSNNKHLKGIEKSNKVALNLKLKEDYKRQWFGNVNIGYGLVSANRYSVKGNLMNFGKKSKYYCIGNLNNIGADVTGDIYELLNGSAVEESSNINHDLMAKQLINSNEIILPNFKQKRITFNNTEMVNFNSIFTVSEKTKIKTLFFLNTDEKDFYSNNFNSFTAGNTNFTNTENFVGRKSQALGIGKIDLIYDVSKNTTLEYNSVFNYTVQNNNNQLLFNANLLQEQLSNTNTNIDQKISFTNKFASNKIFLFTARYCYEQKPQNYTIDQFLFTDIFNENASSTLQKSENKVHLGIIEAKLLNKLNNKDLLELKIGNQSRVDRLNSSFYLLNDNAIIASPFSYQNDVSFVVNDIYIESKYMFQFKKFSFSAQSDFHKLFTNISNNATSSKPSPFFVIPSVKIDWNYNTNNKFFTSYTYNTINSSILETYSGFIQTGFRSFSKGINTFNTLNTSNVLLGHTYGGWNSKFFINTILIYTKDHDFFSTNSLITQNVAQLQTMVIKDKYSYSLSSTIERYFKPIKSNFKVNLGVFDVNFKNSINDSTLREIKNLGANYGFEIRSGFKGFFNYHIGTTWNYNQIKTTINNTVNNSMNFVDLSFKWNKKINFQIQTERYFFSNLESSNRNYYFLDFESQFVVKENQFILSLSGNNLLNTEFFKNYTITDTSIIKTEYRLQPRYVLLKIEFRF